jgi:putative oxidoreductase
VSRALDWKGHAWLALPARLYLGGVFLIACWFKIADPELFALDVATYRVLPLSLVNLQALVLPWVELLAGLLLVLGLRTRAAALLVTGMMSMFLVALLIALARGQEMGCGCFANEGGGDPIGAMTVLRDSIWLALSVYVFTFDRRPLGLDRLLEKKGTSP